MDKKIVLTGFMGAGKSYCVRKYSGKQVVVFCDIDCEIEKDYRLRISRIFSQFGEAFFRQLETQKLIQCCRKSGVQLIAAGGGLPLQDKNLRFLRRQTVIFINTPFPVICRRLKNKKSRRPLTKSLDQKGIRQLWCQRHPVYRRVADYTVADEEMLFSLIDRLIAKTLL